ncbi:hypothetical protein MLD38_010955 [Melastoma candidum]|uniref:Uncharacterized protein n=1 Tax=Melastoma candidum TaxID=119954 RepID=A0ACB9R3A9_9MYRT|nr:hypothetical protein MLD38_010955 [Melastoma candidum]
MGGAAERIDTKEWASNVTSAFLHILLEKLKQVGERPLKTTIWQEIDKVLNEQIGGESYGIDCLRGKYHRLRIIHREFSILLNHTGVGWDPIHNTVTAPEEVW